MYNLNICYSFWYPIFDDIFRVGQNSIELLMALYYVPKFTQGYVLCRILS